MFQGLFCVRAVALRFCCGHAFVTARQMTRNVSLPETRTIRGKGGYGRVSPEIRLL